MVRECKILENVSAMRMHQEERWFRSSGSQRNEGLPRGLPILCSQDFGEIGNGLRSQQGGERQAPIVEPLNFDNHANAKQGMPSQVEEIVVQPNLLHVQYFC